MPLYWHASGIPTGPNLLLSIYGFGAHTTETDGIPSAICRKGLFHKIESTLCVGEHFNWYDPMGVICLDGLNVYSVCWGDSGAPVIVHVRRGVADIEPHVAGFIVQGEGCTAGAKALAVSVEYHANFILAALSNL